MSILFFLTSLASGADTSIHVVGQATCTKAGFEQRITMRSFGDKPVPCDVIYKQSDDKFKKLKVVVDSKKDPGVCRAQFFEYPKALQSQGYACSVTVNPNAGNKNPAPQSPPAPPAVDSVKPEPKPEPKLENKPIDKPEVKVGAPPPPPAPAKNIVPKKPMTKAARAVLRPPAPPPMKTSVPAAPPPPPPTAPKASQKQTPPPPPPN